MVSAKTTLLNAAIARNASMVLSLPSAGMLRHHKSRFLMPFENGFWVESVPDDAVLIDSLIGSAQPCGISFKNEQTRVVFSSAPLKREERFHINATTVVEALLLEYPRDITTVQRRSNYRVHIPMNADWASVRIWRIGEKVDLRDAPMAAQEITAKIRDLSTGGLGATLIGPDNEPPRVSSLDRLRIEIRHQEQCLLLEGRMTHPADPGKQHAIRAGIQFKKMDGDMAGRQTSAHLTRIIGELQREEIRRLRLGMSNE